MKKHLGFTLIELMVVIAIIAILSTAGLAAYTGYIKRAVDVKTRALLEELYGATLAFKGNNNGKLPTKDELSAQIDASIIHPAGNKPSCIRSDDGVSYSSNAQCTIVYYRFSDGKFAFSGGIMSKNTLENFHKTNIDSQDVYGIFVGNSPIITRSEHLLDTAINGYKAETGKDITSMQEIF